MTILLRTSTPHLFGNYTNARNSLGFFICESTAKMIGFQSITRPIHIQQPCYQVHWCMTYSYFEITHWAAICVPLCNSITCQSIVLRAVQTFKRASMQAKLSEAHTLPSTLGCISTPRLFSNNFYLVLKFCIFVKNETSKIFCNWLIFRGASGLPKFDPGSKTCK